MCREHKIRHCTCLNVNPINNLDVTLANSKIKIECGDGVQEYIQLQLLDFASFLLSPPPLHL